MFYTDDPIIRALNFKHINCYLFFTLLMDSKSGKKTSVKKSSEKHGSKKKSKKETENVKAPPSSDVPKNPVAPKGVISEDGDGGGVGGDVEVGVKRRLMGTVPSIKSQDYSVDSFNELVTVNEEGHQYIDVDRLIYQPTNESKRVIGYKHKDNLCEYVPDFSFILLNLLSVATSIYFIMMAFTTLNWKTSIAMFSIPNCSLVLNPPKMDACENESVTLTEKLGNFFYLPCTVLLSSREFQSAKHNFSEANVFPIFRTEFYDPETFGLVVMASEIFHLFNVVSGIGACLKGFKAILIQHIIVDVIIILIELAVSLIITNTGTCDKQDLAVVRLLMAHFVRWYGVSIKEASRQTVKERQLNNQIDSLQIGLDCCGLDGWGDYLPAGYPHWDRPGENIHLAGGESVIPFSCCRRWWIRNIYCSQDAHLWTRPTATEEESNMFHERIVQEGCHFKLEKFCQTMIELYGKYGIVCVIVHTILVIIEAYAAFVLIKNIDKMIQIQKKIMRRKELMHEPGDDGGELDSGGGRKGREGSNAWARLAPPTEDEILTIKQRNNFNKFMAAMKYGRVGKWMDKARQKVTVGHEEPEPEPQTATEKKAREKELLHAAKQKKDPEGHKQRHKHDKDKKKKEVTTDTTVLPESKKEAEHSEVDKDLPSSPTISKKPKKLKKKKEKRKKIETIEESSGTEDEAVRKHRRKRRRRRRKKSLGDRKTWKKYF